jgi:hypothetical protein
MVVVAVMHRLLAEQRRAAGVALLLLLPLALRTHVWSFAVLVVPLTGMYLRSCTKVQVRTHLFVWGAALGLLANLDWLVPALAHRELIVPSAGARTGDARLPDLGPRRALLVDPKRTGFVIQRTVLRALVLRPRAATCGPGGASRTGALHAGR